MHPPRHGYKKSIFQSFKTGKGLLGLIDDAIYFKKLINKMKPISSYKSIDI